MQYPWIILDRHELSWSSTSPSSQRVLLPQPPAIPGQHRLLVMVAGFLGLPTQRAELHLWDKDLGGNELIRGVLNQSTETAMKAVVGAAIQSHLFDGGVAPAGTLLAMTPSGLPSSGTEKSYLSVWQV